MAVRTRTDPAGRRRYDIEFQQRGRRIFERCPPDTTLAQARERETALRRGTYESDTLGHQPEVLLSEVIQGWLNTKPHKYHQNVVNKANQLATFVAGKRVSEAPEVAKAAATKWLAQTSPLPAMWTVNTAKTSSTERPKKSLSLATINRRLAVLKAALTWHGREDLSHKIKLRREQNGREVYLTREQVKALAKCTDTPEIRSAILVAAYTGLRASELLALTSTDLRKDTLTVGTSKNGKPRLIPFPSLLRGPLSALPLGLDYWQLHKGFSAARKAAGLGPEVTFHTLRHSFASWMINAGVDILTLSKLLGHSSVNVTQRYAHLYDSTLRDAVRKLR